MRSQNWPELLADYLQAALRRPFSWGEHDCGTFAAGWVELATGVRPVVPLFASALEYARAEEAEGGMLMLATRAFGTPMADCRMAGRGDIVLVPMDGRLCLGIVTGAHVAGPGADGLLFTARSEIVASWAV